MRYEEWARRRIENGEEVSPRAVWDYFAVKIKVLTVEHAINNRDMIQSFSVEELKGYIQQKMIHAIIEELIPHLEQRDEPFLNIGRKFTLKLRIFDENERGIKAISNGHQERDGIHRPALQGPTRGGDGIHATDVDVGGTVQDNVH